MREFEEVENLTADQLGQLCAMYQDEWWTRGRRLADVEEMVANSTLVFGLVSPAGRLEAFARVLSDGVYKAFLFDVIVRTERRNRGLGDRLMSYVLRHPKLDCVKHVELYCLAEHAAFYERFQFSSNVGEVGLMRRSSRSSSVN